MDAFPPSGDLLIVSPHLDDAALSCDALLARDGSTDVLTVFAGMPEPPRRSFWDERCGFRDSSESMPARKREEEAALSKDVRRLIFLELLEHQYVERPRTADDAGALVDAVTTWLGTEREATIALPAGAGWTPRWASSGLVDLLSRWRGPAPHVDHIFVRDVLLTRIPSGRPVILYEEFPYSWAGAADRAANRAAEEGGYAAVPVAAEVDRERKARRLAAYGSQIPYLSPPSMPLDDPAVVPPIERYWRLERRPEGR